MSGREDSRNNWTHINGEYVVMMRGVHRSLSSSWYLLIQRTLVPRWYLRDV